MQTSSRQHRWLVSVILGGVVATLGCQPNTPAPEQTQQKSTPSLPAADPDQPPAGASVAAVSPAPSAPLQTEEKAPGAPPAQEPQVEKKAPEQPAAQPSEPAKMEADKPAEEAEAPGFLPNEPEEREFPFQIPAEWKRLSEKEEIWIDAKAKMVAVSGRICLNRGLLEMFACPKGTKEHESVVATYPWAMYVHQALLLAGVNPGQTVQWEPEYKPAEGPKINVEVWYYNDQQELVKKNAKDMIRLVSDGSTLKIDWVFGGSRFLTDPDGRELYAANGGELICVSNFSSAMIDLPIPSTAEAGALLFEANTEQIPPLNTPVLLVLTAEQAEAADGSEAKGSGESQGEQVPAERPQPPAVEGGGGS